MAFCENCGKPVYRLDRTCVNCGMPVTQSAQPTQQEAQSPIRNGDDSSIQSAPYAVLSSWGFVGSLLLMALPIAGFIITIVWASGGTVNLNRRNLARGYLILMGIGLALYILIFVAVLVFGGSAYLLDNFIV
jgi:uncharacterized membrane protein YvbJ